MIKAYKYRIYPSLDQKLLIDKTFGCCRLVYNLALEAKIRAYESANICLSGFDLINQTTELRSQYCFLQEVDSNALQYAARSVETAYKNFFRGLGFPKFKKKQGHQSYVCQQNVRRVDWAKSTLSISKIKNIPIVLSRKFDGNIKRVTISKTPSNKYFASILVCDDLEFPKTLAPKNAIGIDLGISTFATISTGEKINNPRHLRSELDRLKTLQRRASRKNKCSKNRLKANLRVAILHEKIANQRKDFLHKVSSKLIGDNQTDTICLETLSVRNMVKNHKLAQAINDVSWSEFVRMLEYKGKWYGKNIIKINRFYASSKTCSNCGHVKDEMNISERAWDCSNCGSTHDRDINAAINIRNSGMGNAGEPVELRPIGRAKKQEIKAKGVSAS